MSTYSIWKNLQPNEFDKNKMIKMIKNKLTPLSQNQKFPMGKHSYLNFKNLQKVPKLRRQHFAFKSRKSLSEEQILNNYITNQINKSKKQLKQELYERPSHWLQLWKKTGDSFQNSYFTARPQNTQTIRSSLQCCYPQDFQSKMCLKNSQSHSLTKRAKAIFRKVEIYKNLKTQQIQQKKKKLKSKIYNKNNTNLGQNQQNCQNKIKRSTSKQKSIKFQIQSKKCIQKEEQQENKLEIQHNNDWIYFITKHIFNLHVPQTQEQKLFEQFTNRKHENKLKDYIKIFQDNKIHKRTYKSCHIQNKQAETNKIFHQTGRLQQKSIVIQNKITQAGKNSQFSERQSQVLSFHNPTLKLKRLKSICKGIDSQFTQNNGKNNFSSSYSCSKLRINSNHKKIIQTSKILCNKA